MGASGALYETPTAPLPNLLSIGKDCHLLTLRGEVLRSAGFQVQSSWLDQASDLVAREFYPIAVFGHSLSNLEAAELATALRAASPRTKLLLLNAFELRTAAVEQLFDATLHCSEGPTALVKTVQELSLPETPPDAYTSQ